MNLNENQVCTICEKPITNPLCIHCLEKEVKEWVSDFNPELMDKVEEITELMPENISEVRCIKCKRAMSICAHCYIKEILREIQLNNPEFVGDFIRTFDFDLVLSLVKLQERIRELITKKDKLIV